VELTCRTVVTCSLDDDIVGVTVNANGDLGAVLILELALGTFDVDETTGNANFGATFDRYGFLSNATHNSCFYFSLSILLGKPGTPFIVNGENQRSRNAASGDFAKHLATNVFASSFAITDHASTATDDADSQPTKHWLEFFTTGVHATSGLADTLDRLDHTLTIGPIFQF